MEKAIMLDVELGELVTYAELLFEYTTLKDMGETEAETFEDYLENITNKNGTCIWI